MQWDNLPTDLVLSENKIHIWMVDTKKYVKCYEKLFLYLSMDEKIRADRFFSIHHKVDYIIARSMLRLLLGKYLNTCPEMLHFEYNDHGKPHLTTELYTHNLHFNLAHSNNLVLYIFAKNIKVGIDVEKIKSLHDFMGIAESNFAPNDIMELQALPTNKRLMHFYKIWTRKEAFTKMLGVGLTYPLDSFEICSAGKYANVYVSGTEKQFENVALFDFDPCNGYVATCAFELQTNEIKCFKAESSSAFFKIFDTIATINSRLAQEIKC